MSKVICRCPAGDLSASLLRCSGYGHRSYVPWARSCEWGDCAYENLPASEQGRL